MEKLNLDLGVRKFRLGQGVLCFNPADPNVYARFLEAADRIAAMEQGLPQQAQGLDGAGSLALMKELDGKIKAELAGVFGPGNDLDAALGGVNVLAVASNGERVITNLFAALEPVLVAGAKACADQEAAAALAKRKERRG